MSNSKNILYLISLILLMLTGCEADTTLAPLPNPGEEPVEVRFHATTFGANVEVSRAENYTEKNTLTADDKIGIWNDYYSNIKMIYNESDAVNLNTENGEKTYYPYQTEEMKIYAYAPYSTEAYDNEKNTIRVKSEWVVEKGLDNYITDPIWATATTTKEQATTEPVDLEFQHVMSRLKIYLVNDERKSYNLIYVNLTFDRTQYGEMSLETGNITPTLTNYHYEVFDINDLKTTLLPKEDTTEPHFDHTVLPGSKLKCISVWIMTEQGLKKYLSSDENVTFPEFERGKTNKIFINVGKIENK